MKNPGDGNLADGATFTVLVTAKHASATVVPDIPVDQIYVGGMQLDAAQMTSTPSTGSLIFFGTEAPFVAKVVYTVGLVPYMPEEIALNPNFADSSGLDLSTDLNAAPTVGDAIDAQNLAIGAAAATINVASNFSDSDTLIYSAMSSDDTKATVSVATGTSVVVITPVAAGSATITVTATDTAGQVVDQDFMVTVSDPSNLAPTAVGTIDAQNLTVDADATEIDVESNFSDTDALTYSAVSSDDTKATASVADGTSVVVITPVVAGSATITITATDTANQTATQTIEVTVSDPIAPTLDISLVANSLDTTAKTFQVKFTFAKAGTDQADVPSAFAGANVQVTTDAAGEVVASVPVPTIIALLGGGTWIATIDYNLAALPLYIGQTDDVSATTVSGEDSTSGLLTVEMSNAAPVAVGTIAAHTLTAGADAMAIDVASNFSDTDGLPIVRCPVMILKQLSLLLDRWYL